MIHSTDHNDVRSGPGGASESGALTTHALDADANAGLWETAGESAAQQLDPPRHRFAYAGLAGGSAPIVFLSRRSE